MSKQKLSELGMYGAPAYGDIPSREDLEKLEYKNAYYRLAKWFASNTPKSKVDKDSQTYKDVIFIHDRTRHEKYGYHDFDLNKDFKLEKGRFWNGKYWQEPEKTIVDNTNQRLTKSVKDGKLEEKQAGKAIYWASWDLITNNRKVFSDYFSELLKPNYNSTENPGIKKYGRDLVHTFWNVIGVFDPTPASDGINFFLYFEDYQEEKKKIQETINNKDLDTKEKIKKIDESNNKIREAMFGAVASVISAAMPFVVPAVITSISRIGRAAIPNFVVSGIKIILKKLAAKIPRFREFIDDILIKVFKDEETMQIAYYRSVADGSKSVRPAREAGVSSLALKAAAKITDKKEAQKILVAIINRMIPATKAQYWTTVVFSTFFITTMDTEIGKAAIEEILKMPISAIIYLLENVFSKDSLNKFVVWFSQQPDFAEDPVLGPTFASRFRDIMLEILGNAIKRVDIEEKQQKEKANPSLNLPSSSVETTDSGGQEMNENILKIKNFNDLKKLVEQVLREELLLEGGAGGHMRHPFDLDDVKTGMDLLRKFEQIGEQIKAGARPDTKIDGVNTSIKVIDGPNGKEFAMDRGSGKPEDIEGMTVDRLLNRFGEGHGMVTAGKNVLNIFNDALPEISPELKELGLLDDPSKFFNMEYVKGTTNVLAYDHDFLKIHGVNQFYNKKDRKGSIIRPGAERPLDPETGKEIKDPAVPASYNKEAMEKMVEILNKYSEKYGFKVYSSIGSKAVGDFDFTPVLSVPAPVTYSEGNVEEKTLGERLKVAKNRIGETVKTVDGRKPPAQGKEVYKAVLGAAAADKNADPSRQVPLSRMLQSEEDYQKAIDGAVFWHATRLFGNVIIENMEVDHPAVKGPAKDHEGLVIRLPGDDFDIKITGEFILGGEASAFRSDSPEPAKKAKTVGIFPGSFKPPHKGHLSVIKGVLQNPEIDEVKVIISAPSKEVRSPKITPEKAKEVFEKYIAASNFTKPVSVEVATKPSPIGVAYEYIGEKAEPNETVVLLTSQADASRYPQSVLDKAVSMNKNASTIKAKSLVLPACRDEGCSTAEKVSATTIRNIIDAFPNVTIEDVKRATSLMPDEMSMSDKLSVFELLVGEPLTSKFGEEEIEGIKSLEEASVAVSISGYAGSVGKKQEDGTIYNMKEKLSLEENILKDYLVERYVDKFKTLIKEVDAATATGMTYVTDAFSTTKSNFEKRFGGLGEQDQRVSFLVNFLNKMVHGFIQQDVGEGIPPVMPFDELVEKGILTFDISQSAQEFAQSALEEGELNEQEGEDEAPAEEPAAPEGEEEAPETPEAEGGDIEGLVPDEDADAEAEKEKEQQDKMKAGQISPEVTEEPLPNTNETGNRAALAYYKLDSKNIFRFYNLIGPEDTADREQFIEFYFKNVIALAAGIERSKSGNLPEPLNTMFNKLSTGSDVVKEPQLEAPAVEAPAAPAPAPEAAPAAPLQEGDISRIIKKSVVDTFKRLQFR